MYTEARIMSAGSSFSVPRMLVKASMTRDRVSGITMIR